MAKSKYGNEPQRKMIGGKEYRFRSKFEYRWALYLQFLKEHGKIQAWDFESTRFIFDGVENRPREYTPDFEITDYDGSCYFQECKGHHDSQTNSKFRRIHEHFPDEVMELVLLRIPKSGTKGVNRRRIAAKYTRRIIDASEIFKQIKGLPLTD